MHRTPKLATASMRGKHANAKTDYKRAGQSRQQSKVIQSALRLDKLCV